MPKASPSTRAMNDVRVQCGMFNFPARLYSGTVSDHGVKRQEWLPVPVLDKTGKQKIAVTEVDGKKVRQPMFEDHKVGRGAIDKVTGELLSYAEQAQVQKKMETEDGQLVWMTDAEIEDLFSIQPDTLVVKTFQPSAVFNQGAYVPKKVIFLEPGRDNKKNLDKTAVTALSGLLATMRHEGLVAVCELTTRGLPKPAILTADGAIYEVYHTDALREQREVPLVEVNDAGVNAVKAKVIDAVGITTEPVDLTDRRAELVAAFAEEKAAAGDFALAEDTYEKRQPAETSGDVDLLALLGESVEQAKARAS